MTPPDTPRSMFPRDSPRDYSSKVPLSPRNYSLEVPLSPRSSGGSPSNYSSEALVAPRFCGSLLMQCCL